MARSPMGRLRVYFNIFRNIVLLFFYFIFSPFFPFHPSAALPSVFYRSAYIFFRGRPRSYVADVFSRFISEILSWSNFHCDLAVRYTFSYTPTCISQCHPPFPAIPFLSPTPVLSISHPLLHFFHSMRFYLWFCLPYRPDSTHSRAVSYSQPPWQ